MTTIYHGGNLDIPSTNGAAGLWATDSIEAARDYARSCAYQNPDAIAYVYRIDVDGAAAALRDAVPADLADRVEAGEPAALAYSDLGPVLASRGVGTVIVEMGDEHPETGREHRSWWVIGTYEAEVIEEIEDEI